MPGADRRPTLDDLAEAVGVSRATVSNAYNRPDQLSATLRTKVLEVAAQLEYGGPDPVARGLATNRTGAIAVLLETGLSAAFSDPALRVTLDALASKADAEGHALLLLPGGHEGGPRADQIRTAQASVAVAYSLSDDTPALEAVRQRGLPLVVIDQPAVAGAAAVSIDDRSGAASAAQYLVGLGHRRFAVLSARCRRTSDVEPIAIAEAMNSRFRDNRDRLAGYLDVLAEAGINVHDVPIREASGVVREHATYAARQLLSATPRPTAVLCMSDELALATLSVARERGVEVPGQLSVVGFDDAPPANCSVPELTTVRQDLVRKGELGGEIALRLIAGHETPASTVLSTELVVRGSTGPAPASSTQSRSGQ